MNFREKKIDLDKMQSLLEVSKKFKFAVISWSTIQSINQSSLFLAPVFLGLE